MQITGDVTCETQEWDGKSYCMTSPQQLQHIDPFCIHNTKKLKPHQNTLKDQPNLKLRDLKASGSSSPCPRHTAPAKHGGMRGIELMPTQMTTHFTLQLNIAQPLMCQWEGTSPAIPAESHIWVTLQLPKTVLSLSNPKWQWKASPIYRCFSIYTCTFPWSCGSKPFYRGIPK